MNNLSEKNDLKGLILAGGESSRMGTDKSLIDFHGFPQREYLFQLLQNFCTKVFLSCKTKDNIPAHLNPLPDKFAIRSPLNGILTAFAEDARVAWLTVPVDMPFVDDEVISHLIANRKKEKVATCFYDADGSAPEPLLTLWEPHAGPLLQSFFEQGKLSPRDFLEEQDICILRVNRKNVSTNVNSPEDLKKFRDTRDHSS